MCSSSYSPMSHEPSDDILVLLRQMLSKSSSSSSSSSFVTKQQLQQLHFASVANVAVNVGAIDYDHTDDYDCESKVYAYHRSFLMPITSYKFGSTDTDKTSDDNTQFVSSICWRGISNMIVASNSGRSIMYLKCCEVALTTK
ncbi:suppressor of PHYA-105 1-like protein isoform X1 [Tanacetum coccineum]